MNGVASQARRLLAAARAAAAGHPQAAPMLDAAAARFDEPLRVAIAGRVKAGKSTLLNALVGEELAPTDAGECTRAVTWYRDGFTYRVSIVPVDGPSRPARFQRDGGAIDIDLGGLRAEQIRRIDVEWPSASLREVTLIDTPGVASLSTDIAARAFDFLAPEEGVPEADAVLYLVRHVHPEDVRLLESFHGEGLAEASAASAIGILARADEVGAGRLDALESAARVADRYRHDAGLRRLCQTIVPVAGLLAQGGAGLRETDVTMLGKLASLPAETLDELTLSVDRFTADRDDVPVEPLARRDLLDRLGFFGVRLSLQRMRSGETTTATALSELLVQSSGLPELWRTLEAQFEARAGVLKARSALRAIEAALRMPGFVAPDLEAEVERVISSGHELAELRTLDAIRRGELGFSEQECVDAERLLGLSGADPASRLALPPDAGPDAVRAAAVTAAARWQDRAEHPLSTRAVAEAARVLVRTCEGLLLL